MPRQLRNQIALLHKQLRANRIATHVPDNPKLPVACASPGRGITQVDIETDQGALTLSHAAPTRGRR